MTKKNFRGIKQINGTNSGFSESNLEEGYVNFIRTDESGNTGYIYLNGKKYGEDETYIDCGTY